jgi:hypothetical protein
MVLEPTHPILYLRAANHRRGFKSVVCETPLDNVTLVDKQKLIKVKTKFKRAELLEKKFSFENAKKM